MKWTPWMLIPIASVLLGLYGFVAPEAFGARIICDGMSCGYDNGGALMYLAIGGGWLFWLWVKEQKP